MPSIYNIVSKNLNKNYSFENNPRVCVAVSGGPDSIALTFILNKWISKNNGEIFAVIIDHQIRKDSSEESKLVKDYLDNSKIKSIILKVAEENVIKKNMNQARKNRFSILTNFCKKNDILHLFLGHHYDDNIETFILRKIAGSNIQGLISMKEKTLFEGIQIIRPLLKFNKSELLDYNNKEGLITINDPSNLNDKYSRIVVRKYLRKNSNFRKNAIKDFNFIEANYKDYILMINQLFNTCSLKISLRDIELNLFKFFELDLDIQIKFIEIIYKFHQPAKPYLRYEKIKNSIIQIKKSVNGPIYLSKMKIKIDQNAIKFSS